MGLSGWHLKCFVLGQFRIVAKQNLCQDKLSFSIWKNVLEVSIAILSILGEIARDSPISSFSRIPRVEAIFVDNIWRKFIRTVPKLFNFRFLSKFFMDKIKLNLKGQPKSFVLKDFYFCDNSFWNCLVYPLLYFKKDIASGIQLMHNTDLIVRNNLLYGIDPVFRHV